MSGEKIGQELEAPLALLLRQPGIDAVVEGVTFLATAGACGIAGGISRSRAASGVFLGLCLYGAIGVGGAALFGPPQRAEIDKQFDAAARVWVETSRRSGTDPERLVSEIARPRGSASSRVR